MPNHIENGSINSDRKYQSPAFSDEIDLMDVLYRMVLLISRYKKLLIASIILAVITSIAWRYVLPASYSSSIVIHTPLLGYKEMEQLVMAYDLKLKDESSVNYGLAKKIEMIKTQNTDQDRSYVINAVVGHPEDFKKLQEDLLQTINSNEYVSKLNEAQRIKTVGMIKELEGEEQKLNRVLEHTITNNVSSENFAVADIARLKVDLSKQKLDLQAQLINFSNLSVIKSFDATSKPSNKQLLKILGLPLLAWLVLSALFIIVNEVRIGVRSYHESLQPNVTQARAVPPVPVIKRGNYQRPRVRQ